MSLNMMKLSENNCLSKAENFIFPGSPAFAEDDGMRYAEDDGVGVCRGRR